jgi:hypothetical protein
MGDAIANFENIIGTVLNIMKILTFWTWTWNHFQFILPEFLAHIISCTGPF